MALYMISYDLHNRRVYTKLYELLTAWKAQRLLDSLWLAELRGPAGALRQMLIDTLDSDNAVAVIELKIGSQWATTRGQQAGVDWLKLHIP